MLVCQPQSLHTFQAGQVLWREEHTLLTLLRTSVCTISYNSYSAAIL